LPSFVPVDVFKALGDPTRLAILGRLAAGDQTRAVSEIAACCTVDLSVVSRHLKVLAHAGIVESERRGKQVLYRVRIPNLVARLRALADALESCCGAGS
jgi:ArsR family transcriptional regulator